MGEDRVGWGLLVTVLWPGSCWMTHIRRAPLVTCDFSALRWELITHKARFETGIDERRWNSWFGFIPFRSDFSSQCAALIIIKTAAVYQKTCHERDIMTGGGGWHCHITSPHFKAEILVLISGMMNGFVTTIYAFALIIFVFERGRQRSSSIII